MAARSRCPTRQHPEGPESGSLPSGEGKKYKSRLLQWHSWAKDLGASDRKKPWEDVGISQCGLKEIQGLVLDSEPIGPLQEWKHLGGRFQRGKFPRDDCLLLTGTETKLASLPSSLAHGLLRDLCFSS